MDIAPVPCINTRLSWLRIKIPMRRVCLRVFAPDVIFKLSMIMLPGIGAVHSSALEGSHLAGDPPVVIKEVSERRGDGAGSELAAAGHGRQATGRRSDDEAAKEAGAFSQGGGEGAGRSRESTRAALVTLATAEAQPTAAWPAMLKTCASGMKSSSPCPPRIGSSTPSKPKLPVSSPMP